LLRLVSYHTGFTMQGKIKTNIAILAIIPTAIIVIMLILSSIGSFNISLSGFTTAGANNTTLMASVNVSETITLSLSAATINFGALVQGTANNTTNDAPNPFVLVNGGNIGIDLTIKMNQSPFSGTGSGNNTNTFRFKAGNCSTIVCGTGNSTIFNWGTSQTNFQNFTTVNQNLIKNLSYSSGNDVAEAEILLSVPSDESTGSKSVAITFTASKTG